jgi:hypothetical protein
MQVKLIPSGDIVNVPRAEAERLFSLGEAESCNIGCNGNPLPETMSHEDYGVEPESQIETKKVKKLKQ